MRGIGDLLAFVLRPVEPLISRFGPKRGCGCKKRQEVLNQIVPFSRDPARADYIKRKMDEYQDRLRKIEEQNNNKVQDS